MAFACAALVPVLDAAGADCERAARDRVWMEYDSPELVCDRGQTFSAAVGRLAVAADVGGMLWAVLRARTRCRVVRLGWVTGTGAGGTEDEDEASSAALASLPLRVTTETWGDIGFLDLSEPLMTILPGG